jgi:hypothetical protein
MAYITKGKIKFNFTIHGQHTTEELESLWWRYFYTKHGTKINNVKIQVSKIEEVPHKKNPYTTKINLYRNIIKDCIKSSLYKVKHKKSWLNDNKVIFNIWINKLTICRVIFEGDRVSISPTIAFPVDIIILALSDPDFNEKFKQSFDKFLKQPYPC